MISIEGPVKRHKGSDTGSDEGNMYSILYIYILRIHILTHAPPSIPLGFGARARVLARGLRWCALRARERTKG